MPSLVLTITWADVVLSVPAMASVLSAPQQNAILAEVKNRLCDDNGQPRNSDWGDRLNLAATYLAAHIGAISLRKANSAIGPVTDMSVDDVSRSWAAPAEIDDYDSTNWGRRFKAIRDAIFRFPSTLMYRY